MDGVREATAADRGLVAGIMADAFEEDPVMAWALPDRVTRPDGLEALFGSLFARCRGAGGTSHLVDGGCATIWFPPLAAGDEIADPEDAEPFPAERFSEDELLRLGHLGEVFDAGHPDEPHWYLGSIGTASAHRGRGLGARALAPVLERCDADGVLAYLESTNPRNRTLYRRHGFVEAGELALDGGPTVTRMLRTPRPPQG